MKLFQSLLLPALLGTASALSDASVYIFQSDESPSTSPILTPEQARLVFAQRLGTSRYHGLGDANEDTLGYIKKFGGHGGSLFRDSGDKAANLILIVEGMDSQSWSTIQPAFTISSPPGILANKKLALDLNQQCGHEQRRCALEDDINPLNEDCWTGKSKVIHIDVAKEKTHSERDMLLSMDNRFAQLAKNGEMDVVVVFMPSDAKSQKSYPYGKYDKVAQSPMKRSEVSEEPMTEDVWINITPKYSNKQVQALQDTTPNNSTSKPITGIPKLCHTSIDSCNNATNSCSGHGQCLKKYGDGDSACYTCFCSATRKNITYAGGTKNGFTLQNWAGAACQKEDISDSFWLIAIFTIVIIGVVNWAIAMIFSIGEEKLPGVIGAGVIGKTK